MAPEALQFDEARDAELAAKLIALRDEREAILDLSHPELASELAELARVRAERLKVAEDAREYRRADVRARARLAVQTAHAEFAASKAELRQQMLAVNGTVRRRVDSLRYPRVAMKRRRSQPRAAVVRRAAVAGFVGELENQGVLRLSLSPDEVNADLASAMRAVDVARTRAMPVGATAGSSALQPLPDAFVSPSERVHTSRGILHFHDDIFEKGDTIAVYAANKHGSLPKYHGVIQAINRKEIIMRIGESTQHRLNVGNLKNGRLLMRRDPTGTSLRTARLGK